MDDFMKVVKEHPLAIGLAVIAVVILAYMHKSSAATTAPSGDGSGVTFTGGGEIAPPTDPNTAAVEEAQISGTSARLTTLSQLYLGLTQSAYAKDVAEGQTSAALTASLAQTEAERATSLAQTEAGVTINAQDTAASIQNNITSTSSAQRIAQINSDTAKAVAASNLSAVQNTNQTQKDIARAADNTKIAGGIIGFGEDVLKIFTLGFL